MTRILRFPSFTDPTGCLTPIEKGTVPFPIRRIFYLHDVPAGARRGGHAHHEMQEVVIALSGAFDVVTIDAKGPRHWGLNRADRGLYLEAGVWRYLDNFSSNAVALALASTEYDPSDYIWDREMFIASLPPIEESYWQRRGKAQTQDELVRIEK